MTNPVRDDDFRLPSGRPDSRVIKYLSVDGDDDRVRLPRAITNPPPVLRRRTRVSSDGTPKPGPAALDSITTSAAADVGWRHVAGTNSLVVDPSDNFLLACSSVDQSESPLCSVHLATRVHGLCRRAVNTGVQNDTRVGHP